MQNNYYFLRQLSKTLANRLVGLAFTTCFSQDKDELVLGFAGATQNDDKREFYLKAVLHPDFACLAFPDDFQRARKNSVDLFGELLGLRVQTVVQYLNERSFSLVFEQEYTLLFKMHGNRANLVLFREEEVVGLFHHKLAADNTIRLAELDRPLVQTYEAFLQANGQVNQLFPTFGKSLLRYLESQGLTQLPPTSQWQLIQDLLKQLENPTFFITRLNDEPMLSLVPVGDIQLETPDPLQAANAFYRLHSQLHFLEKEKKEAIRMLNRRKQQTENYLLKNHEKLEELEKGARNEQIANILMANLHQIPPRSEAVELFDFYHNQPIHIKLKKDLNAQKNAEVYYRKGKNEKIELNTLRDNTALKEQELKQIEVHIQAIEPIEQIKELRKYLKTAGLTIEKVPETPQALFKQFMCEGFVIWVGRNAKNNDLLTQQYAFKEDLWLHARDVTGSHVIIKYQAGKKFSQMVIEKAAQLAAYYSKRKNDSLCPVVVTPKKFVRKPKGLPEGTVVIDKEEVLLVVPRGE